MFARRLNDSSPIHVSEALSGDILGPGRAFICPGNRHLKIRRTPQGYMIVLVDQAPRHSSAAVVIAGEVAEHGFKYLKAPVKMVTALDTSVPYSEPMETYVLPSEEKIVQGVKSVLAMQAAAV